MIDIGCNLTHRRFRADLAEVIHRAQEASVDRMVVTGLSEDVSRRAEALAASRPETLRCTAGIHPHNARTASREAADVLGRLAARPVVRAVGECGLDYDRDFSPRDVQRRVFELQLELAAEVRAGGLRAQDVLEARMIADPLTMLMCAQVNDGGAAMILTTLERSARAAPN